VANFVLEAVAEALGGGAVGLGADAGTVTGLAIAPGMEMRARLGLLLRLGDDET